MAEVWIGTRLPASWSNLRGCGEGTASTTNTSAPERIPRFTDSPFDSARDFSVGRARA
jgi:hypothetical protein